MKLYELTENYRNLQDLLENPEIDNDLIEKALDEVGEQLEEKAENIAKLIKTLEVEVTGFKTEEKRLADKRKTEIEFNKGFLIATIFGFVFIVLTY